MRILDLPSSTYDHVVNRLDELGAADLFLEQMVGPLWQAAFRYGIDPVGLIAQSYKETGAGTFKGQVTAQFYNPCGLKVRHPGKFPGIDDGDMPLAHAQFASWDVGAQAHAQHVIAYTGNPRLMMRARADLIVDPRWWLVAGKREVTTWEGMSTKWAPSRTYGQEIAAIARRLQSREAPPS